MWTMEVTLIFDPALGRAKLGVRSRAGGLPCAGRPQAGMHARKQVRAPTRNLGPGHRRLRHRNAQAGRQEEQLHVKAPALQPLVGEERLGCSAREQLQAHGAAQQGHRWGLPQGGLPAAWPVAALRPSAGRLGPALKPHWVSRTAPPATNRTSTWKPRMRKLRAQLRLASASLSKCARLPTAMPLAPPGSPAGAGACCTRRCARTAQGCMQQVLAWAAPCRAHLLTAGRRGPDPPPALPGRPRWWRRLHPSAAAARPAPPASRPSQHSPGQGPPLSLTCHQGQQCVCGGGASPCPC